VTTTAGHEPTTATADHVDPHAVEAFAGQDLFNAIYVAHRP
jgi:hypothetical protein